MNPWVLLVVAAALVALRWAKAGMLGWLAAWWIAAYVVVRFGVHPPLPSSIVNLLLGIVTLGLITYLFSDTQRLRETKRPLVRFMTEPRFALPLVAVILAVPALVAFRVYLGMSDEILVPASGRTIHPAPPGSITFRGKTIDLIQATNPFRALEAGDPEGFRAHVENGSRVYYQNCVFCHGDNLEGDGIYAHALDPLPANLADAGTIGVLQESYLFWRIAKGGPGLPEESTPWSSAMPVWESYLTEDEIWEVILFLYDHTGLRPRAREEAAP